MAQVPADVGDPIRQGPVGKEPRIRGYGPDVGNVQGVEVGGVHLPALELDPGRGAQAGFQNGPVDLWLLPEEIRVRLQLDHGIGSLPDDPIRAVSHWRRPEIPGVHLGRIESFQAGGD